jgi:hypothetical protein
VVRAAAKERKQNNLTRAAPRPNATAAHTMSDNLIFPYGCMTNCLGACCFFACLGSTLPRFRFVSFECQLPSCTCVETRHSYAPKNTNAHSKAWQLDGLLGASDEYLIIYILSSQKVFAKWTATHWKLDEVLVCFHCTSFVFLKWEFFRVSSLNALLI